MKRIIVLFSIVVFSISCDNMQSEWEKAKKANTNVAYHEFLEKYPNSPHVLNKEGQIETVMEYGGINSQGISMTRYDYFSYDDQEFEIVYSPFCQVVGFDKQGDGTPTMIGMSEVHFHKDASYRIKGVKLFKTKMESNWSDKQSLLVLYIELIESGTGESGVTIGL